MDNGPEFISKALDRWAESEPDLSEVASVWLSEDPGFFAFDMAIQMWARQAPAVAKVVHRVDDAWIKLLSRLFESAKYDPVEALVRARVTYFHQVGYYALDIRKTLADQLKLVTVYYKVLTGKSPGEELDRVIKTVDPRLRVKRR